MPPAVSSPQSPPGAKRWAEVGRGHGRGPRSPRVLRCGVVGPGGSQARPRPPPPSSPARPAHPPCRPPCPPAYFLRVHGEGLSPPGRTCHRKRVRSPKSPKSPRCPLSRPPPARSRPAEVPPVRAQPARAPLRSRGCQGERAARGRAGCERATPAHACAGHPHQRRMERCLSACACLLQLPLSWHPFSCAIAAVLAMSHWAPSSQACAEGPGASSAQDASRTYSISPLSLGGAVAVGQAQLSSGKKYAGMERQRKCGGRS